MSNADNFVSVLFLLYVLDEKTPNMNIVLMQNVCEIGVLEQEFDFCIFIPADTRSTSIMPIIQF